MRRRVKRGLRALPAVVCAVAGGWLWYTTRDYGSMFRQRAGRLARMERAVAVEESESTVWELALTSDTGLRAGARMRAPRREGKFTGVLLAAGLETGARVVDLIGDRDDLVVLAVDYDWGGKEFDIRTTSKLVGVLRELRAKSSDSVPRLLLGIEALTREPKVDTNRLAVVGVSYGAYYALPAAVLDLRMQRLILVQGGGTLGRTVSANAARWQTPLPAPVAGGLGATLFLPWAPERWIGQLPPRRVTFIASRNDPLLPADAVSAVYARAGEPKELIWHDVSHVGPNAAEIIAELSRIVLEKLGAEPPVD